MEMLSSFRGEKHELCLVVIKFKRVRSCPSIMNHNRIISSYVHVIYIYFYVHVYIYICVCIYIHILFIYSHMLCLFM